MEPDRERVYSRQQFYQWTRRSVSRRSVSERGPAGCTGTFMRSVMCLPREGHTISGRGDGRSRQRYPRGCDDRGSSAFHCFVSDEGSAPVVTYNIMFTPVFRRPSIGL